MLLCPCAICRTVQSGDQEGIILVTCSDQRATGCFATRRLDGVCRPYHVQGPVERGLSERQFLAKMRYQSFHLVHPLPWGVLWKAGYSDVSRVLHKKPDLWSNEFRKSKQISLLYYLLELLIHILKF